MRKHGEHLGVMYRYQKWSIRQLAHEYKLVFDDYRDNCLVYADNMKDLKSKIQEKAQ